MNWTRAGILAFVALCIWAAWPKGQNPAPPRPLLIKAALKDASDPVVILGDGIVERATLPRSICGRPVINAGIAGSTTASNLDAMLIKVLGSKQAAMIVVSIGVDDAAIPLSAESYKANYLTLLKALKTTTSRLAVASVTSIETAPSQSDQTKSVAIDSYNAVLPVIAQDANATLLVIPPMPAKHTVDGLHLNADGYAIWNKALLGGVESALCQAK
jgi:lysophospholipase L1-like esterase